MAPVMCCLKRIIEYNDSEDNDSRDGTIAVAMLRKGCCGRLSRDGNNVGSCQGAVVVSMPLVFAATFQKI